MPLIVFKNLRMQSKHEFMPHSEMIIIQSSCGAKLGHCSCLLRITVNIVAMLHISVPWLTLPRADCLHQQIKGTNSILLEGFGEGTDTMVQSW